MLTRQELYQLSQFFKEASIPLGPAVHYNLMLIVNWIQKSMLLDLNKDTMIELDRTMVSNITKHTNLVYHQDMCKDATESMPCSPSPSPGILGHAVSRSFPK